jgi:hypothetical protein
LVICPRVANVLRHFPLRASGACFKNRISMANDAEVFNGKRFDFSTGDYVSIGDPKMGTREAIQSDGLVVDLMSQVFCPHEWLDEHGYVDLALAAKHPWPHQRLAFGRRTSATRGRVKDALRRCQRTR